MDLDTVKRKYKVLSVRTGYIVAIDKKHMRIVRLNYSRDEKDQLVFTLDTTQ